MDERQMTEQERVAAGRYGPETLELKFPVQFGSESITELVIRPSSKHFRGFALPMFQGNSGETQGMMMDYHRLAELGIRMAGKPPSLVDLLHPHDLREVAEVVFSFLFNGPKTGSTPSPS